MVEETLVILKPDAVVRGVLGELVTRFERKGLLLVACKLKKLSELELRDHYSHLVDKPFFPRIVEFMQSAPVLLQVWRGNEAVAVVRAMAGPTNGCAAAPGTIRGDYGLSIQCNLVHASESKSHAESEVRRFFSAGEIESYSVPQREFVVAPDEI